MHTCTHQPLNLSNSGGGGGRREKGAVTSQGFFSDSYNQGIHLIPEYKFRNVKTGLIQAD